MGKYNTSTGEFELNELLNFFTVPDLKDLASIFGYRYKSTTRKAYIVSHLSDLMLKEPELIINGAFCYELEAFQAIIDGKMNVDDALEACWPHTLNRYGLIYVTRNKNTGEKKLHFEKEVAERLKPLIQPELDRRKNIKADLIEKVVIGCTNIYGFTDLAYILKYLQIIKRKLGIELNEVDLFKILFPMYCQAFKNNDIPPYLSPFAKSIGFYPDEEHIDYSIEPKEYDIDTIIKYGEMPYPTIAIAQTAKLKEKLLKYSNRDAGSIDKIINDLWLCKQCDGDYISYISDIFSCHNIDQLNECTQATVDFLNNVPFWRLRGNSSHEIAQIEMQEMRRSGQMPKIVIGPNMRAMGIESFEQIQEMAKRGEDFPVQPSGAYTGRKVGRNDPCPCGSGKKYKHCCGK